MRRIEKKLIVLALRDALHDLALGNFGPFVYIAVEDKVLGVRVVVAGWTYPASRLVNPSITLSLWFNYRSLKNNNAPEMVMHTIESRMNERSLLRQPDQLSKAH